MTAVVIVTEENFHRRNMDPSRTGSDQNDPEVVRLQRVRARAMGILTTTTVGLQALNDRMILEYAPLLIQLLMLCNLTFDRQKRYAERKAIDAEHKESEAVPQGVRKMQEDDNSRSEHNNESEHLTGEVSSDEDFSSEPSEQPDWEVVDLDPVEWTII